MTNQEPVSTAAIIRVMQTLSDDTGIGDALECLRRGLVAPRYHIHRSSNVRS